MWHKLHRMILAAVMVLAAGMAQAVNIDLVTVGNTGNTGEWSGEDYGGSGPDRLCGAVNYTYNIGKYEVTAGQYTEFLNAVGGVDTYWLYNTRMSSTSYGSGITRSGGGTVLDPYTYTVDPAFTNRPVNNVSWGDAARFANWLHNGQPTGAQSLSTTEDGAYYVNGAMSNAALLAVTRKPNATWVIPSEDEWYKAAYHKNDGNTGNYFDYPTSSNGPPGQDMSDVSGHNANYYTAPYAYPIDSGKYTTIVGEFQNSASPYGTFDQAGNVWEWIESVLYGSGRGWKGGSYSIEGTGLEASIRSGNTPANEGDNLGFRVAYVPEPGSITLVFVSAISLLTYAWRRRK